MVSIHPPLVPFLTPGRAEELTSSGLFADDLDGIRAADAGVRDLWDATIERARRLAPAQLDPDGLSRTCAPRDGQFQVVGALQVVLFESWAHHQYATRDLAVLERAGD